LRCRKAIFSQVDPDQPATRRPVPPNLVSRKMQILVSFPHGTASFFAGLILHVGPHGLVFFSDFYSRFYWLPGQNSGEAAIYSSIYPVYTTVYLIQVYLIQRGVDQAGWGTGDRSGSEPGVWMPEAGASPGTRKRVSHERTSSQGHFDGGRRARERRGTRDGGKFPRLRRLMAEDPPGVKGNPIIVPGHSRGHFSRAWWRVLP
jgi:hypothetical protein